MNHRGDGKFMMIHREMRSNCNLLHTDRKFAISCIIFNESDQKLKNLPRFTKNKISYKIKIHAKFKKNLQ